jgi:hypothetical protein
VIDYITEDQEEYRGFDESSFPQPSSEPGDAAPVVSVVRGRGVVIFELSTYERR